MKDPYNIRKTAISITRWIGSPTSVIVHTILFVGCFFAVAEEWIQFEEMLLLLTTIVSLEAIYLSIFIQMTINYTTQELRAVGEDIEELQEDVGEIQEDMGEIQENVGELQEDVEEISEDVEEMSEEDGEDAAQKKTLTDIQADLKKLMHDIEKLQKSTTSPIQK